MASVALVWDFEFSKRCSITRDDVKKGLDRWVSWVWLLTGQSLDWDAVKKKLFTNVPEG